MGRTSLPIFTATVVIIIVLALIVPAAALSPADPATHDKGPLPAVKIRNTSVSTPATVQTETVTPKPTVSPLRQTRVSLLQSLLKNPVERPTINLPAIWFVILVAAAFFGLGIILYHLLWGGRKPGIGHKMPSAEIPRNVTILDEPLPRDPHRIEYGMPGSGPGVSFPPSLEKRFVNPEFIGEGGLARVFRARNVKSGTVVAVKVPTRFDELTGTHFSRDIAFWQNLEHENIIRVRSSNILPVPYIEMEYAPSSLAAMRFPLPEERAVALILGIARGVAYAHSKGIVHRDLKPENVLIGDDGTPKITDWGLGKSMADPRQSSMLGFSPSYAAPEQIAPYRYGKPGPATDIYQLGMLLYEMLTGSVAFSGEGMHDLNTAILDTPPVIPSWGGPHEPELRKILLTCLAKNPGERYASAEDLIRDLETVMGNCGTSPHSG